MASFADEVASNSSTGKDEYFKVKNGDNRIRVVDRPSIIVSRFDGKKFVGVCFEGAPYCADLPEGSRLNKKWKAWVIDRADGVMKLYDMPWKVADQLLTLSKNPEYAFNTDPWSMPYDVTINVTGAGTLEAEYAVIAARKETPLTEAEVAEYRKKRSAADIVALVKEKARKEHEDKNSIQLDEPARSEDTISPDDIPF